MRYRAIAILSVENKPNCMKKICTTTFLALKQSIPNKYSHNYQRYEKYRKQKMKGKDIIQLLPFIFSIFRIIQLNHVQVKISYSY